MPSRRKDLEDFKLARDPSTVTYSLIITMIRAGMDVHYPQLSETATSIPQAPVAARSPPLLLQPSADRNTGEEVKERAKTELEIDVVIVASTSCGITSSSDFVLKILGP